MADDDNTNPGLSGWPAPVVPPPIADATAPRPGVPSEPSPPSTSDPVSTIDPIVVRPAEGPLTPLPGTTLRVEHDRRPTAQPTATDIPPSVRDLLDADGAAIVVVRNGEVIDHVNRAMLSLLGADSIGELIGDSPANGVLRSFLDHLPHELRERDGAEWHGDFDHRSPDGESRILRATVRVDAAADADRTIALLLHDVTESRERLARLRHRASHDPLTGLANRHQILGDLSRAIADQRGRPGHVAVIFVDLDHLKYVNDAFGHRVGDQLIASTAQRLTSAVRPTDRVARIGGDEFVVVSDDVDEAITALELAERIRRTLTGHLRVGDLDVEFSVSVGIALTDPDVLDLDDESAAGLLVGNADTAMYEAKEAGRGRCTLFTSQMRVAARERTELAAALARSVATRQLAVDYQCVFSTVTKTAVGAEALVRWNHPTRGRLEPASFIAVAEESGVIAELGEQVLDRALHDLRDWISRGVVPPDFSLHVNVSRVQLGSASFVNLVRSKLRDQHIEPHQLVLEARETSLLGRVADVDRSIRALRRFGVDVAVDNFGTGPKALAVMTDVGADVLKLDGSLALPSGSTDAQTRLVRAVVLLAHALDMRVVAERVSGFEQLFRLRAAGCDMVQGNLLSPARPADEISLDAVTDW